MQSNLSKIWVIDPHLNSGKCDYTMQVSLALYTHNRSTVLVGLPFLTSHCTTTKEMVTTPYQLHLKPASTCDSRELENNITHMQPAEVYSMHKICSSHTSVKYLQVN